MTSDVKTATAKRLVNDNDIKERWREYYKLLNKDSIGSLGTREDTLLALHTFYCRTKVAKVNKAFARMKAENASNKVLRMPRRNWINMVN